MGRADLIGRHILRGPLDHPGIVFRQMVLDAGRIDQLALDVVEIQVGRKIIASRARLIGDNRPRATCQGVEETALAGIRPPNEYHANSHGRLATERQLFDKSGDLRACIVKLPQEFRGSDERQILVGEIESGLEVGQ